MQIEFSKIIQAKTDAEGGEVTADEIWSGFQDEYLPNPGEPVGPHRTALRHGQSTTDKDGATRSPSRPWWTASTTVLTGTGNGPISAFFDALAAASASTPGCWTTRSTRMSEGASAQAASYIECAIDGKVLWGIGIDANTTRASLKAVVSAVNRAAR